MMIIVVGRKRWCNLLSILQAALLSLQPGSCIEVMHQWQKNSAIKEVINRDRDAKLMSSCTAEVVRGS